MRIARLVSLASLVSIAAACAEAQTPAPSAPTPTAATTEVPGAPVPSASAGATAAASGADGGAAPADEGPDAAFRSCQADADCVAVERVGCCHNGHKVAVAASQRDAYAKSFTCGSPRPMCPQYRINDMRVPYCDAAQHLCAMKAP
jgi:hypothetical protein